MIRKQVVCSLFVFIASATALAASSLAWFSTSRQASVSGATFAVANTDSNELIGLNVYKFVYPSVSIGDDDSYVDYLSPQNGEVQKYTYNEELGKFGVFENDLFEERNANMNVYDPVDYLINHSPLISMNTNVIYECKIKFTGGSAKLKVDTLLRTVDIGEKEIKASSCLDFNILLEGDLTSELLEDDGHKNYYPSYMQQSKTMTEDEAVYHKLSYLSFLESTTHMNFFSDDSLEEFTLYNGDCDVDENMVTTVYINVNYNMQVLTSFVDAVRLDKLTVVDDYIFRFGYGV